MGWAFLKLESTPSKEKKHKSINFSSNHHQTACFQELFIQIILNCRMKSLVNSPLTAWLKACRTLEDRPAILAANMLQAATIQAMQKKTRNNPRAKSVAFVFLDSGAWYYFFPPEGGNV